MPFRLPEGRVAVMGVLNVTPDSFSDGGQFFDTGAAVARGLQMAAEGADMVDVGGESTRPGAEPVPLDEELRRVVPVVEGLVSQGVAVSIDTSKPEVARESLRAGAAVVNDVTGLRDRAMVEVCAEAGCTVCVMHMLGDPRTMQINPMYADVVAEVRDYLVGQAGMARAAGIEDVWIDPGIGFGKAVSHNLALLNHLEMLVATGYPVLVGVSRKSFIGKVLGDAPVADRLEGTLAAQVIAQVRGARIVRSHDVAAAARAATVAQAVLSSG